MVIMPGIPIGGIATEQLVPVEMSGPVYLGGELDFAMCFSSGGEEKAASLVVLVGVGSGVEAIRSIILCRCIRLGIGNRPPRF